MSKILISLTGTDNISNIQLIKELNFIDKYLFITPDEPEKDAIQNWIVKSSLAEQNKLIETILVNELDFEDIEHKLSSLSFNDFDELFVNLTGGSKIMTIAALSFFKELGAKIFYVDSNKNQYIKIFPRSHQKIFQFKTEITVKEYLEGYGFEILNQGIITQTVEVTNSVFSYFSQFFNPENNLVSPHSDVFPELQSCRSKKQVEISKIKGLDLLLNDLKFNVQTPGFVSKDEIVYLSGGWFEEYIYNRIKSEFSLDEKYIAIGANVQKKEVPNEFDVAFIYKNIFYTIECKTSVYYVENGKTKTIIGDFVYKCDSLQSELGLNPIVAIATLSALKDKNGKINSIAEAHYKRAELYKINILAYSDISSGKTFSELLRMV